MQHEQIHILPPKSTYHTKQKETKTFNATILHKKQLKHFQKKHSLNFHKTLVAHQQQPKNSNWI